MHGPSHLLLGWFIGEAGGATTPQERRLVAWAGFAPDVDVLAYLGAIVWFGLDKDRAFAEVWQVIHHRYTHGIGFIVLVAVLAGWWAGRRGDPGARRRVAVLAVLAGVAHLFGDLMAGGPTWPLYPYWPLSDLAWIQDRSWTLGQWPNTAILAGLLVAMLVYPRYRGHSPMEAFHYGLERGFVAITQQPLLGTGTTTAGSSRQRWLIYGVLLLVILAVLAPLGFRLDS